jgi:NADH-quinone oxidoreductase subunit N
MIPTIQELTHYLPLIIIGAGILVSLTIEMFYKGSKKVLPWFSVVLFLVNAYYSLYNVHDQAYTTSTMLASGGIIHIFYFLFNFSAAIVVFLSYDYIRKTGIYYGEFYILVQSAVLGMMLMASAQDLVVIFLGLEQMSICFYVLAGINRKKKKSTEAALKYFLLGSFASGFIVYGMALIYGTTTTLSLPEIFVNVKHLSGSILFYLGMILFIIGFAFKIAAFPFHMWVPDVYQGAPTTVTALMSTAGKTAAFASLIAVLIPVIHIFDENLFRPFLSVLAVFSMVYGSIVAIVQTDIKRMLAYSSIAHAGYMLIGLAAGTGNGTTGIVYYLTAYSFMNLGAFGIVAFVEGMEENNLSIDNYSGLSNQTPVIAGLLALFMFALSGIPPFAGFFGKYYVFISAIESGLTWLAIVGVLSSVISVYFYLRVVVVMYFRKQDSPVTLINSKSSLLGIFISAILVVLLGVFPGTFIDLINYFVK